MALHALRRDFTARATALGFGALAALSPLHMASAGDAGVQLASYNNLGMCDSYEVDSAGEDYGAFGSAKRFSEAEENDIGIVIYTGNDLAPKKALSAAAKATQVLNDNGYPTNCYVGAHRADQPTAYIYLVNGHAVPGDKMALNIRQFGEEFRNVAAEAHLVRASGIKGNPDYLLSSAAPANDDQ